MNQTGFEGPEKIVEFVFALPPGCSSDFRALKQKRWEEILEVASCSILASLSNDYLDSYILSESSMFVYKSGVIVKTCGTTTLLKICPLIEQLGKELGMELQWITYCRKNFYFPQRQKYPHQSFKEELDYLNSFFQGQAFILGPLTSDHWYFYVADYTPIELPSSTDITLNLWMYDMDKSVAEQFFQDKGYTTEQVTEISGISKIFPGSMIHSHNFEPCGYSMNGLYNSNYWTIHVTPEAHCSYVSFETTVKLDSYTDLVQLVLSIFKPGKFTLSLFADQCIIKQLTENPIDVNEFVFQDDPSRSYFRTVSSSSFISNGYISAVGNWYLANDCKTAMQYALGLTPNFIQQNVGEL